MQEMTKDCEYLAACPIFKRFKTEGLKNVWIAFYCQGMQQPKCARKLLKKAGKEVPITLLPNGEHLDILDRKPEETG